MNYYSCGKLLITAEYLVLKGAKGLAIPTKYGQKLSVKKNRKKYIIWEAYTCDNEKWIDCKFDLSFKLLKSKKTKSEYIYSVSKLLRKINELSPGFADHGLNISTTLEFKRNWGLGSSSTLINNISNWLKLNPYELLKITRPISNAIKKNLSTKEIEDIAISEGMITMKAYAAELIEQQLTTISELCKLCN